MADLEIFHEVEEVQQEVDAIADDCLVDLTKPKPLPDFIFSFGGVGTFPRGEVICIKGKAKNGKSQLAYYLISALLGAKLDGIEVLRPDIKVCVFDTEQGDYNVVEDIHRSLRTAGLPLTENRDNLRVLALRSKSRKEKEERIMANLEKYKPDLIFIDGIRDFIGDINKGDDAQELATWLLQTSKEYLCTIVCVIHENKSKDDRSMRGALGTELKNAMTYCYSVEKVSGRFQVSLDDGDTRNLPTKPLAFCIGADGAYYPAKYMEPPKEDYQGSRIDPNDVKRVMGLCFAYRSPLSKKELSELYQGFGGVSEAMFNSRLPIALKNGFVEYQPQTKTYSLKP